MAKIYTSESDERAIDLVLRKGLNATQLPKWAVLRLALARSMRIDTLPDESFEKPETKGSEYHFEQVLGYGQDKDYTNTVCALLSTLHNEDLFSSEERFRRTLQRHIRRGLREIKTTWSESHDFHEYLYQELLFDRTTAQEELSLDDRLLRSLGELDIQPVLKEKISGARIDRYLLELPDLNDLDRLRRGLDKLAFALGLGGSQLLLTGTQEPKTVGLDVPRDMDTWTRFDGKNLREWSKHPPKHMKLPVWPAVDVLGEPLCFDLAEAPHLFVGGTTGSGKSVCLHALIQSLVLSRSAEDVRLVLIDPKRVEFAPYHTLKSYFYQDGLAFEAADADRLLISLIAEMNDRERRMAEARVRDVSDLTVKGRARLPRIVVFVEELADLLMQAPATEDYLVRIAQKARASGIHLVLATQRPDAETFSGLLRSNVPSRICLTVQKSAESRIVLDDAGAERLVGKGDMLVKLIGKTIMRAHGVEARTTDFSVG